MTLKYRDPNGKAHIELEPHDAAIVVRRNPDGKLTVTGVYALGTDPTKPPIENPPATLAVLFGVKAITEVFGREGDPDEAEVQVSGLIGEDEPS